MYNDEEKNVVTETPVEEKAEVTETKEENNQQEVKEVVEAQPEAITIDETEEQLLAEIEAKRADFHNGYKKRRSLSRIAMAVALALIIGAIVCILQKQMLFNVIGYVLAGVAFIGMLVYYLLVKKKLPLNGKVYIEEVTKLINKFVFIDKCFSDLNELPGKKISNMEFGLEKVFNEGIDIGSRNFLTGKYNGKEFEVREVALYYASNDPKAKRNTRQVGFLGKYVTTPNNYNFNGRFVINLKNKDAAKVVDQPTNVDDLTLVKEEDNLAVYGPSDVQLKDILGTTFLGKIKKIQVESPLLNVIIVVWAGHTSFYLSYDDPVTTLPYDKPFQQDAQRGYRRDFIEIMDILESVK